MSADFRSVHTSLWRTDDWFQTLETDARLFWIYLFTNPSASAAGIYRLTVRTMAFESGLEEARVWELLRQFEQDGKAYYENGVVWVRKMREYQAPGKLSPKLAAHYEAELAKIPDCRLKTEYMIGYRYPIDTLSIPHQTGSDTLSIPNRTDTDTETETETRQRTQPTPADTVSARYAHMVNAIGQTGNYGAQPEKFRGWFAQTAMTYGRTDFETAVSKMAADYRAGDMGGLTVWQRTEQYLRAAAVNSNGHGPKLILYVDPAAPEGLA